MDALKLPLVDLGIIDINEPGDDYAICATAVIDIFAEPVTNSFTLAILPGKEASASGKVGKQAFKTYADLKPFVLDEEFVSVLKQLQEVIQDQKQQKREFEETLDMLNQPAV